MSAPYRYSSDSESDDEAPEVVSQATARQGRKEQERLARLAKEQWVGISLPHEAR